MASPFSIFRKHQRAMMAVLGIMCMFAFTFTGFMGGLGSGSGGNQQDPVAVRTSFGDLRESDLQEMRRQRNLVKDFLRQAIVLTIEPQMRPFFEPRLAEMLDRQIIGPSSDSALVESRVLAREAKREGIVVSDDSITDFLRERTGDQVRGEQFQDILNRLSRNRGVVSKAMLFEAIRTELLAEKMKDMFVFGLQSTPAERWDYFQRLKRRVRIELAPVAAADMVSKVSNPPDDVARKFFEEYKDREPQPGSPEPGFKIPHRAAFRYFELHYQDFYHPEEISEAEIQQHYEKFKDTQYLFSQLQGPGDEDDEDVVEPATPEKKPAEKPPEGKQTEKKQTEEKQAGDKKPASTKTEDKNPTDQPGEKRPAGKQPEDKDAPPPVPEKPQPPKTDQQGKAELDGDEQGSDAPGPNCGSAAPADADEQESSDEPSDQPAGDPPPAASQPADKPAADRAAADKSAADKAAADKASAAGQEPPAASDKQATGAAPGGAASPAAGSGGSTGPKLSTAPPLSDRYLLPRDITKGPNPKYEPLWQAEPKIRKQLAGTKAVQKMEKVVLELKGKLRPYVESYLAWENRKKQEQNSGRSAPATTQRPSPPDFEAIAKNMVGVTVGRIPLAPDYQIADAPGVGGSQVGGQPFVAFAATGLRLFHAVESQDNEGNRYLFWKTNDQETRVPDFDEARNEVVQVWKLREARRPMLEKAEELAKKARESRKSLKDSLTGQPGVEVIETPAFSWMTGGSAGQFAARSEPRRSEVPGTVDIGDEFMQQVFDLQVGDVGVAENHPQTVAYVVRMTTSEPPQAVLRDMFVVERFDSYQSVATETNRSLYQQWLREQMNAFDVHWVRPPYDEMRGE